MKNHENEKLTQLQEKTVETQTDWALVAVAGVTVTLYLTANIMAVKLISIYGISYFDAGTITFPFVYMLGDVLTEIWGYHAAKRIIWRETKDNSGITTLEFGWGAWGSRTNLTYVPINGSLEVDV